MLRNIVTVFTKVKNIYFNSVSKSKDTISCSCTYRSLDYFFAGEERKLLYCFFFPKNDPRSRNYSLFNSLDKTSITK